MYFGLSIFMYAYISMYNLNKDYPSKCSVVYIPRSDNSEIEKDYLIWRF